MLGIAVSNVSTVVSDQDVQRAIEALQIQGDRAFGPAWQLFTMFRFLPKGQKPTKGEAQLLVADNSDQVGALGYHETTANGDPIGYAFAKTDIDDGVSWTITLSHEAFELRADPEINLCAEVDNADGSMVFYSYEVADACEDDSYGYPAHDVSGKPIMLTNGKQLLLSDFVTPEYFRPMAPAGAKLDFCGHITKPLQILPNGYMSVLNVASGTGWQQLNEKLEAGGKPIVPLSRRARRRIPKRQWKPSEK